MGSREHRVSGGPGAAQVRPAEASDIEALLTVEQQCFSAPYYGYYVLERPDFECYLEDTEDVFLVATQNGRAVAYVLGPADTWREPPTAHIDSIAVLRDSRNKGIGSALLRSFMAQVQRQGCKLVTLEVSAANESGLTFFARHGFHKVRRLHNYYGTGLHALLLATKI